MKYIAKNVVKNGNKVGELSQRHNRHIILEMVMEVLHYVVINNPPSPSRREDTLLN